MFVELYIKMYNFNFNKLQKKGNCQSCQNQFYIISLTYLIDLFCVVVFVTKNLRVRMCNTNNELILWIKDFTVYVLIGSFEGKIACAHLRCMLRKYVHLNLQTIVHIKFNYGPIAYSYVCILIK